MTVAEGTPGLTTDTISERLAGIARRLFPGSAGVAGLQRLSGGASLESWSFETGGATPRRLILRRAINGVEQERAIAADLATEAALIRIAGLTGVPVPLVRHVLEPGDGLGAGFVMDRVEGETIPRKILRDARFASALGKLAAQSGRALAAIHAMQLGDLPLRTAYAEREIKLYHDRYQQQGHPHPVFELALRWLRDNLPPPLDRPAVVHGDFRLGNLMVDDNGLAAVLDWELCHQGDPMEDLGYIAVRSWRFGNMDRPIGGFATRAALYDAYEAAGGKLDRDRVRFWEILGTLKWGIVTGGMARTFASVIDASIDRGMIGRRASETEIDLLALLTGRD